ncbi:MAG: anthranilate synthase component I family protein [Vampirovibrionales bacterium]|nr:anthranilate synthase component I family protein [Vampirovibrionales bacterium]
MSLLPPPQRAVFAWLQRIAPTWPTLAFFDATGCKPGVLNTWTIAALGCRRALRVHSGYIWHTEQALCWQKTAAATPQSVQQSLRQFLSACKKPSLQKPEHLPPWPLQRGAWLYLGYEAAPWFDSAILAPPQPASTPDLLCVEPSAWLIQHKPTGQWQVVAAESDRIRQVSGQFEAFLTDHNFADGQSSEPSTKAWHAQGLEASLSPEAFSAQVASLQQAIARGETYQANLSIRFQTALTLQEHPLRLLQALCLRNPSPFSGMIQTPDFTLLSNSPERLVSVSPSGVIESRPIAGTRGRGDADVSDDALGERLRGNLKEQAEHSMLVDLIRNDLGRVATAGSVHVSELMTLERYSHVTHLVSNVVGQRAPSKDAVDVMQAFFPGATITGCPKLRTMALLQQAEPVPRGFYTGSMGYVCADTGALDLNILIRSLMLTPPKGSQSKAKPAPSYEYQASFHAGAGIVADSVAQYEYRECLRKAQILMAVLGISPQ